jgi:predicted dehydrogenase
VSRAAIVGTGFAARVHARALRELGVTVAAVCGRTRAGADALAAELGGTAAYDDLNELLRAEAPEVLHVCTPNHVHAGQALAALARGVHVVCEKPLACSSEESARMLDEAERRSLVAATAYHVRGYPLVEHMRAEIAAGALGRLVSVHGRYLCDDALAGPGGWRLDPARSGPSYVTADLGTHWLDAAEYVSGARVAAVCADLRTVAPGGELEDLATLLLRFVSGAGGTASFSALVPGRKNQLLLECDGEAGGFTWDQEAPETLLHRPAAEPVRLVVKDPAANAGRAPQLARLPAGHGEGYAGAFRNLLGDVYRAVAGEARDGFPTFADGHRGMLLLEGVLESGRRREWVEVGG